ncbi:uracil-DNA glycosylase [Alkalimarinus alittae]|uniref:Uracil-DNA glycosylase n=1 Tax=Alkalimarinus alittae TaxID=2961619 RepID=A0ABY6MZR4_9ALTE|nr:uracil-DNA glycosylase [Alkalimarinus alittae]UZE95239.1 uracil-DNA glycosylase [Alkalimarinus alittae]
MSDALHESWQNVLVSEFNQPYMKSLHAFLASEKQAGKVIYPPESQVFNAFNHTHFDDAKVVILGQDPYHGIGQAHGLSFSVQSGVKVPPSLVNIYKEIERDIGIARPSHGCLTSWSDQGVLLLNAVLTVEQANAGAHQKKGWEMFTDKVIASLNEKKDNLVFLLWGSYAQKKGALIERERHCVLEAPHPSPLSAHRGFLGCGHFSKTNEYLASIGKPEIDWRV